MSEVDWKILFKTQVKTLQELDLFSAKIALQLGKRAVVALMGPMAAGKTTFVKALCRNWGIQDVSSPTFTIHQRYEGNAIQVEHLDLYRIEQSSELDSIGFWELFLNTDPCVILIEWAEKMDLIQIPQEWTLYKIEISVERDERIFSISRRG